ncbi:hypothetical protein EJB05_54475 [Eragrostis curvula]|uniref:Uncharacterized protein n=1 Tax=Eragrostis curvula TaxID=38414 RepID=A0A5J9SMC6_9POAL|nr:hypothetical protein EJB05_54475 [Eragrostis curvula]
MGFLANDGPSTLRSEPAPYGPTARLARCRGGNLWRDTAAPTCVQRADAVAEPRASRSNPNPAVGAVLIGVRSGDGAGARTAVPHPNQWQGHLLRGLKPRDSALGAPVGKVADTGASSRRAFQFPVFSNRLPAATVPLS